MSKPFFLAGPKCPPNSWATQTKVLSNM